jgi:tRNA threonylcarbamoyladenosine biosynthesis protein TsaE
MVSRTLVFNSPGEMQNWGKRIARTLKAGDIVALVGGLGAGKTTLVQAIAEAWGYRRGATSPTFVLANEYPTPKGVIYHLDMYRLSRKELAVFPLEEYWGQGLCLIEWADRVRDRLPAATPEIHLNITAPNQRTIKVVPGTTFDFDRRQ